MNYEYAFLSCLVPEQMREVVYQNSKHNMQDAANALEWHIYDGLCQNLNCEVKIINILPIASYPQYYKKAFIKKEIFSTENSQENVNLGFCNVKFIRKYSQYLSAYKRVKQWLGSSPNPKTVFVYTASVPFLKALNRLKKEFDVKVCVIIADLPHLTSLSSKKSLIKSWSNAYLAKKSYRLLSQVDYYVLLTKHMADYLKIDKPYCVMEGIATGAEEFNTPIYDSKIKTVFYAGTLHKRFGVLHLLKAFGLISDPYYRLVICGAGDSEQEIIDAAKVDDRIIFHGQLPRSEVLKLIASATVLVNPRQNNEEFTKYSFPSKNLEYLSSGVPLIAYKLDGIPNEYDEFIYYVEDNSIESMVGKIIEVCELSIERRIICGKAAQHFVINNKNEVVQTRKIIEMIWNR